ncbi:unnamed protein product [Symbiodinium necroappetens]|uniref:Uncharacterized protein n=1 Tax=Symbiodinium necroappetens TaxID=1628268 RepID=A0A813BWX8_9DINO|nr:unnamed protein product [Symbiodinium microadriaticum]CAE7930203.1 unnamed protein product [Symbiodinium necroappetens]
MALVAFVRGFTLAPLGRMGSRCPEPQDFCWRWPGCSSRLKQSEALLLLIFGGERVHVAPATKSFTAAHMHVTCPRPMGICCGSGHLCMPAPALVISNPSEDSAFAAKFA